ncbi:MAG: YIP1 family protein [Verrucomicrobiota bacterium]
MEESQPTSLLETPPPSTSLLSRLTNVFVAPGEVFDEIKSSPPQPANWIVPLVLSMIAGVIYTLIVFSQPAITQKIHEAQEKKFREMVASGKMTQVQADQAMTIAQKFTGPGFLKTVGCVSAVVASAAMLFLMALVFWAVGKRALHGNFEYMKAVEALGLASMISVLGAIVAMLLAVIYGNMAMTPGPALLLSNFDVTNKGHRILSALNVMSLWYVAVVALALAKLSGTKFMKAALWVFGIWAVLTFVPILVFGGK